jgi:hypothetical protein
LPGIEQPGAHLSLSRHVGNQPKDFFPATVRYPSNRDFEKNKPTQGVTILIRNGDPIGTLVAIYLFNMPGS